MLCCAFINKHHVPSYLILGAQKSGTTTLFELISQHSLALKGMRRESHYLDWHWDLTIPTPISLAHSRSSVEGSTHDSIALQAETDYFEQHHRNYVKFFQSDMLKTHPSLFTGESTPSYLLHRYFEPHVL